MGRPTLPIGSHGNIRYYKSRSSNSWRAQTLYRDLDGQSRYVEAHGRTQSKAKTALLDKLTKRRVVATAAGGITADTRIVELAEIWWTAFRAKDRSPGTERTYRLYLDQDVLGRLRIRETSILILDTFMATVAETRGKSAAKTTRSVVSGMFGLAARHDAIDHNPVRDVDSISIKHKPAKALDLTQARDLRIKIHADQRAIDRDLPDLTDMMLATGLRLGEALAVVWDALGLDTEGEEAVEIRGTVIRIKGVGLVNKPEPKSEAGYRTLAIPSWHAARLRAGRPADAQPSDPVFPAVLAGGLRDPSNANHQLRDAFDDAGYTWVTSHVYRKTVATLMDEYGCTARHAADQLGHANISMTQNVYFGRNRTVTEGARVMEQIVETAAHNDEQAAPSDEDAA